MLFRDRRDAGRALAEELQYFRGHPELVVLALPRGGVPVAYEIAKALQAPLDVYLVRKLGAPHHEEFAMGALADDGTIVLNEEAVRELHVTEEQLRSVATQERREIERQRNAYRPGRRPLDVSGQTVILVDDGLATGTTMRAAVAALRKQKPRRIVVAVPVGARETCDQLLDEADEVVCVDMPDHFVGVGRWNHHFDPTSDAEVMTLLRAANTLQEDRHVLTKKGERSVPNKALE
jgi:predicted phosphoribosyltransferase